MKRCMAAVFILMFCTPALATDSLTCNGAKYSLDMSVGSDNIVDSATLSDDQKTITSFRLEEIENRQLVWIDIESDNPGNRLDIVLRSKNGTTFIVEAKGRNGVLRYQKKTHTNSIVIGRGNASQPCAQVRFLRSLGRAFGAPLSS